MLQWICACCDPSDNEHENQLELSAVIEVASAVEAGSWFHSGMVVTMVLKMLDFKKSLKKWS